MKVSFRLLIALFALVLGLAGFAVAQEPVSTGLIIGIQTKEGTLTIRSDQTQNPITFFGVDKANIFTTDGQAGTIGSLSLGTRVTINFAQRENRFYVSKVILPPAAPAVKNFPVNAEPSSTPEQMRANDGDITTSADRKKSEGVQKVKVMR